MGSNTLKFSVTEVDDAGSQAVVHAHAETVRLGAGVAASGVIDPVRIERALVALREYELVARAHGVEAQIGVATAALRMANNGGDLLNAIARTTGWNVTVIAGADEARLAFTGLASTLPSGGALLVDVGGGSTELIAVENHDLIAQESLTIGSGTLADRCFTSDPPGLAEVAAARAEANDVIAASDVWSTASTLTTVALSGGNGQFLEALAGWSRIDIPFTPERFGSLLETVAIVDSGVLAGYLGIAPERARMIPAGAAIAMAVIDRAAPASILALPSGIRGGLVANWIAANPASDGGTRD